ncbi:transposase family protein [Acrocarpospora corrugata]|uniref:transposase family protein n=1 Tax=Acrocarpospora corrugata TaxID=35763 RepID=UPI001C3F5EC8|nr:transposase family protein [Acrocarpospora corrugata]
MGEVVEVLRERSSQVAALGGVQADGLLACLAMIPDPRHRRGVRYTLASIVALCLAAVLCGEKTRTDIVAWVAAAPCWLLAAAGVPMRRGALRAPHADTVERLLLSVDGQAADDVLGGWFALRAGLGIITGPGPGPRAETESEMEPPPVLLVDGQPAAVAVDGKALAGAVDPVSGRAMFLLAAATHTATSVLVAVCVPKSNEIPSFAPLLAGLELTGVVLTMDGLHTQRAHANPAQLAVLVRGHWSIEAMHFVRDVTFREDASTIATGSRPRLMATLRNISIGLIRQSGTRRIAATIRKLKHDPCQLLAMLGLEPHPKWAPDQP